MVLIGIAAIAFALWRLGRYAQVPGMTAVDGLRQLERLRDANLISEEEFQAKRKELVDLAIPRRLGRKSRD